MKKTKSTLAIGTVLTLLTIVLAACGRTTNPGGSASPTDSPATYPTGADQIVLQMASGGGFVPMQVNLAGYPEWTLYGDGTLIVPGAQIEIYPPPALPAVQVQHVTPEGIEQILAAAAEAGLTDGDAEYTTMLVSDAPTTIFTTTANGETSEIAVYALGFTDEGDALSASEKAARATINAFASKLTDLQSWLPKGSVAEAQIWEPTALRVYVLPPAKASDSALEQPDLKWPLATPMAKFGETSAAMVDYRCGVVEGEELQQMLASAAGANQLTNWVDGKDRANLIFRPQLPNETGCGEG